MKISVEWVIDSLLATFFIITAFMIINIAHQMTNAYNYHHYVVSMVEQSHFDSKIMNDLAKQSPYAIVYTDYSLQHDLALYPEESMYLVETTYTIDLPLFNQTFNNTISSIAR